MLCPDKGLYFCELKIAIDQDHASDRHLTSSTSCNHAFFVGLAVPTIGCNPCICVAGRSLTYKIENGARYEPGDW